MRRDLCWPLLFGSTAVVGCPFSTQQRGGRVPCIPSGFATSCRLLRPHCCKLEGAEVPSGPPVDSQVVEVAASGGLVWLPGLWPHTFFSLPASGLLSRCSFVFVLELVPPQCIGNEITALRSMDWGGGKTWLLEDLTGLLCAAPQPLVRSAGAIRGPGLVTLWYAPLNYFYCYYSIILSLSGTSFPRL